MPNLTPTVKLVINGTEVKNPTALEKFQELVQEDRDIMDEAEISLDEILEARELFHKEWDSWE